MRDTEQKEIIMYGTEWCSDCQRAKYFFDQYGVAYLFIDVDENEAGLAFIRQINNGQRIVPTIIFPDGAVLVEPTTEMLAEKTGVAL